MTLGSWHLLRAGLVTLLLATWNVQAQAESPCTAAIAAAEAQAGVPAGLLAAMGVVESGRMGLDGGRQAWPWALNSTGRGRLYNTAEEAIAATARLQQDGQLSVDVGCLQINLMHHPTAFASLQDAFDPVLNVEYAARFLASLRAASVSQDWMEAVGHYHSFRADLAEDYRARVQAVLAGMPAGGLASALAGSLAPGWLLSFHPAGRGFAKVPPPTPFRGNGTLPGDWLHLVTAQPRQAWRTPDAETVLSPNRALALASALDQLAVSGGPCRTCPMH